VPEKSKTSEPIVHTVWVDCPIAEAFRLFTEGFAEWWPLEAHSKNQEDAEWCAMEPWLGGRVFERARDGEEEEWGSIVAWEPPSRLEFTWCPGRPEDRGETVRVEFQVEADGTRVTLLHRGWKRTGETSCAHRTPEWNAILKLCFAGAARQQLVVLNAP